MRTRIALVEDNATLRRQFVERFRFYEDVELVLMSASGEAFLARFHELPPSERPQVVLMDIELPGLSGIEVTARLKEAFPEVEVMMLTVFEEEEKIFAAIQAGASGYLLKDARMDMVVGAVLDVLQGGAPLSAPIARRVLRHVRDQAASPSPPDAQPFDLTGRERELLEYLGSDDTDLTIADRMNISVHTVRTHIKNIYKKLHVHSRASAVHVAMKNKLIS